MTPSIVQPEIYYIFPVRSICSWRHVRIVRTVHRVPQREPTNVAMSRKATVFNSILPALMTDRYLPRNRLLPTGCGVRWNRKSNRRKTISTAVDAPSRRHRLWPSTLYPLPPLSYFFSFSNIRAIERARNKAPWVCIRAKVGPDSGIKTPRGLANFQLFRPFRLFETRRFCWFAQPAHRLLNNET